MKRNLKKYECINPTARLTGGKFYKVIGFKKLFNSCFFCDECDANFILVKCDDGKKRWIKKYRFNF